MFFKNKNHTCHSLPKNRTSCLFKICWMFDVTNKTFVISMTMDNVKLKLWPVKYIHCHTLHRFFYLVFFFLVSTSRIWRITAVCPYIQFVMQSSLNCLKRTWNLPNVNTHLTGSVLLSSKSTVVIEVSKMCMLKFIYDLDGHLSLMSMSWRHIKISMTSAASKLQYVG